MAVQNTQDTNTQQPRSTAGHYSGTGQATGVGTQPNEQRDQERPMQTSHEQGRGRAVSRHQPSAPIQSWNGGLTPFSFMRRVSEDMDRLFSSVGLGSTLTPLNSTLGRDLWTEPLSTATLWSPQVDLFRRGDELVIRADLPGLSKNNISIAAEDNVLTIRGERQQESDDDRGGYYWNERSYGAFQRTIPLPEGANADEAKAEFHDGVLEVTVPAPRHAQQRGRSIQIR